MLIIGNGKVVTRNELGSIIDDGCIAIDKNKIIEVGSTKALKEKYLNCRFIDAKGKLIMPGFINTHMHYYNKHLLMLTFYLISTIAPLKYLKNI